MGKIVSTNELAELIGITPAAVSNWRKRHQGFPRPVPTDRFAVCYDLGEVIEWLEWRGPRQITVTETMEENRMWLASLRAMVSDG